MIDIQQSTFVAQKTTRFCTFGDPANAKYLIVALHGYGQLSHYFIQKFMDLSSDYFIVAPEGMHRFYLNGTAGRVGASWMTKEAREQDIADNMQYLNQLLEQIEGEKFTKKILLGFSQGGATAARYMHVGHFNFDHFILWASVFPPDIEIEPQPKETTKNNYFVVGTNDEYFTDESREHCVNEFQKMNYHTHIYKGTHAIDKDVLTTILMEIEN